MTTTCLICGKPIPETRTSNNKKYCSEKCARQSEREKRRKLIQSRANKMEGKRWKVFVTYDSKCAICGWQATKKIYINGKNYLSHGNECHHIIPVKNGGTEELDNLICLCPNHHKMADMGLISQEQLRCYLKPYSSLKPEENSCVYRIAKAIWGAEE